MKGRRWVGMLVGTVLMAWLPAVSAIAQEAAKEKAPAPAAGAEKLNLETVLSTEDKTQVAQSALEESGPGDNRLFKVSSDDDVNSLEIGDIYKSEGSVFKVTAIASKGGKGGKFTVQRIGGKTKPGRKLSRISGLGPLSVVSSETVWDLYLAGGFFMHPIALCAIAVIVLAINGLWLYRFNLHCPDLLVEQAREYVKSGDIPRLAQAAEKERGILGHVLQAIAAKFEMATTDEIKTYVETVAGKQIGRLRVPLRALNFVTAVAPLLGLLGTVTGMVTCFEAVAFESASASKAQTLAAGIRVALFTTVGGLCVAIPSSFVYFLSSYKLSRIIAQCELLTEELIHDIGLLKRDASGPQNA